MHQFHSSSIAKRIRLYFATLTFPQTFGHLSDKQSMASLGGDVRRVRSILKSAPG